MILSDSMYTEYKTGSLIRGNLTYKCSTEYSGHGGGPGGVISILIWIKASSSADPADGGGVRLYSYIEYIQLAQL